MDSCGNEFLIRHYGCMKLFFILNLLSANFFFLLISFPSFFSFIILMLFDILNLELYHMLKSFVSEISPYIEAIVHFVHPH